MNAINPSQAPIVLVATQLVLLPVTVTHAVLQFILTTIQLKISLPVKLKVTTFHDFAYEVLVLLDVIFTEVNRGLISNDVKCGAVKPQILYNPDNPQTKLLTIPEDASILPLKSLTIMLLISSSIVDGMDSDGE